MIKILDKIQDWIVRLLTLLGEIMLAGIVVVILANVVARYFFKKPFIWTLELCGIFVVWLTFCLFGVCYAQKQHFYITAFDHLMSKKSMKILDWITRVIVFGTLIVLLISGIRSMQMNGRMTLSSMPKVNMAWASYIPMILGITTYILFILFDFIRLIAGEEDWKEGDK